MMYKLSISSRKGIPYHRWIPTTNPKESELVKVCGFIDGIDLSEYVGWIKDVDGSKRFIEVISYNELMDEISIRYTVYNRDKKIKNLLKNV